MKKILGFSHIRDHFHFLTHVELQFANDSLHVIEETSNSIPVTIVHTKDHI